MKAKLAAFLLFFTLVTPSATALVFASPAAACSDTLFGIPAWYAGLQDSACNVPFPKSNTNDSALPNFIIKIALNVIRAGLVIAGYVTLFFIIKGGFLYIIARGDPANIANAKKTLTNAIIGLVISLLSAAIVTAISGAIHT